MQINVYLSLQVKIGKNVATMNDKNNNDWETKGEKKSTGRIYPTNKLFEKSGIGNKRNPPTKPIIIDMYATFSFRFLL